MMDYTFIKDDLETALRGAGKIILSHFNTKLSLHTKDDGSFATQADLQSEAYLMEHLSKIVPSAGFCAEESGVLNQNEYMWVIDPLDGTTNFAHGIPYFCISVALTHNDECLVGAIYQPVTDEFFYAVKGGGATLNNSPLRVSRTKDGVVRPIIGCSLSYKKNGLSYGSIPLLDEQQYATRILGAAALDIAYCASNRFDGVFLYGLFWWDVAAGALILSEAGGKGKTFDGKVIGRETRSFVGGSELIFEKLKNLLKKDIRDC